MTSSASPTFAVNERVLCYHGPLIYEAKVLKVDQSEDHTSGTILPNYFVHYKGWKQTCVPGLTNCNSFILIICVIASRA